MSTFIHTIHINVSLVHYLLLCVISSCSLSSVFSHVVCDYFDVLSVFVVKNYINLITHHD